MQISAPPVNVQGTSDFVLYDAFSGYKPLGVENLQVLRGLMGRWPNSSLICETCLQPIDALLSHARVDNEVLRRADHALFKVFRPVLQILRKLGGDSAIWSKLFFVDMRRIIEVRKRFACHQNCQNALWLTGDATTNSVNSANWGDRDFFKILVGVGGGGGGGAFTV